MANGATRDDLCERTPTDPRVRFRYNAFISYSHAVDGKLAPAIEQGLKRFAKPVFQRRALEVFRDDAALSANPGLWSSIETALERSEHLILMASPEAAASPWVAKEVHYWCQTKPINTALIVVTQGDLCWDDQTADFDWGKTSALPQCLRGAFSEEPRWIDLRWAQSEADISLNNPRFRDAIADLAAPLHHRRKDEILGEDVVQHQRFRLLTRSAITALVVLVIALTTSLIFALTQKNEAERQARLAQEQRAVAEQQRDEARRTQSLFLADLSQQRLNAGDTVTSALLALRALPDNGNRPYVAQAEKSLRSAALVQRELAVLKGDAHSAYSVAASPDGALIAAALDSTLQLWDARSRHPLRALEAHDAKINDVAFSPDGRLLVSASDDATVRIWDVPTGALLPTLRGHEGPVWSAAFSPDGQRIVSGSADGTVRVWSAANVQTVTVLTGHQHWVRCVAFSNDGSRILSASNDGTVKLWDAQSGALLTTLPVSEEWVLAAAFSQDGTRIATGSADNNVRLWDAQSSTLLRTFSGHSQPVTSVAFSSDDGRLVSASFDGTVRLWNIKTGGRVGTLRGHDGWVFSAQFVANDSRIVSASTDGTVRLWAPQRLPGVQTLSGHRDVVLAATLSHDDRHLASASKDGTVRIWDLVSGQTIRVLNGHDEAVSSVAFSHDDRRIASASKDRTARIWGVETGQMVRVLSGHDDRVSTVSFSPKDDRLVTASDDGSVRVWHARSGEVLLTIDAHKETIRSATFSHDGAWIMTASDDGTVRIWDATSGALMMNHEIYSDGVEFAAFSPDDTRIVASSGISATIWDVQPWRLLRTKKLDGPTQSALFSSDGRRVVSASAMGNVRVWDADKGEDHVTLRWGSMHSNTMAPGIPGLVRPVIAARFSHDGNRVAFLPYDDTVRVWFVGRTLGDLMDHVRANLPRCLTVDQEKQFFLREADDDTPIKPDACKRSS